MKDGALAAVTVVGNDRPGIIAGVTKVLFEAGCNLEDATSTILRGHFSMMLIVRLPSTTSTDELGSRLREPSAELGVAITVGVVEELAGEVPPATHMVSVYGGDQPGIVFKVTQRLASAGVNVTALSSRVIGPDDQPVYALMLEVAASGDVEAEVQSLKDELDMDVTVHPIDSALL
jgi:glycine cleavage system transcriptional repressor